MHPITAGRAVVVVPLGDADLALARLIAQQESKSGTPLNLSGLQILHELRVEPQLSIPEIARYLRITEGEVRSGIARMVDACAMAGILPFYGPFGDIKDTVACEDQFRNAYLLGCVGAWSLHPVQIDIARRVFSPELEEVEHAREVIAAMGDGTGAVMLDGKMEDDASVKQCKVVLELARSLAARDPELAELYGF